MRRAETLSMASAMVHANAQLIARFYDAFGRRDAEAMAACYHKDVVFSDPAFGELRGDDARDMWRMLCARAKDLRVEASRIEADDARGSARWVADYRFGKAQRRVHNEIFARFTFRDGLIARHDDAFDLWKWSRQALGASGALLGWTPMIRRAVRKQALSGLRAYQASQRSPR